MAEDSRAKAGDRQRLLHAAIVTWWLVGLLILLWSAFQILGAVRLAVVPLVLALFPAAILSPLSDRLRRHLPPAAVAVLLVVGFVVALFGVLALLGRLIADELPAVVGALEQAHADLDAFLSERFDITLPAVDELLERAREWAMERDLQALGRTFAFTTLEVLAGFLLLLVALFFYLKDGDRLAGFVVHLLPERARDDASEVGRRVWETLGGYFRGQVVVAAVDAVFIGLGLVLLGVPLALALAVLVFLGGMFPVVGAFTAGALAVLVALADAGLGTALAVLALNVVVQQAEGNLLQPVIVGRATRLHPLVVLAALTAGGVAFGILGAFLAVPVTASVVRAVGYLVERRRGTPGDESGGPDGGASERRVPTSGGSQRGGATTDARGRRTRSR